MTTRNFQFLLISGFARQAELGITRATRAFDLEASERETAGWMAMR